MSASGTDEGPGRAVRRGAFPVRRADLEQAEPFVPDPAQEGRAAEHVEGDVVPDGAGSAGPPTGAGSEDRLARETHLDPRDEASPGPS